MMEQERKVENNSDLTLSRASDQRDLIDDVSSRIDQLESDLELFKHSVAHDLKAPLRAINTHMCLLYEETRGKLPATAKPHLEKIRAEVTRLNRFMDDLLALTCFSSDTDSREQVDLKLAVDEALTMAAKPTHERDAAITFDLKVKKIISNRTGIVHVLANLIDNALKFHNVGVKPVVQVESYMMGENVVISVKDNGIGIESTYTQQIFKPFHRLQARDFDGTGIGLSIVERIVTSLNGRVKVQSITGEGTKFIVLLPQNSMPEQSSGERQAIDE